LILADSSQKGVVSLDEAKQEAAAAKLDLVLISPDAEPPVCKIMDYGKHVFELKKQNAANRKKQKVIHVKEIKFRPGTEEGDYQVKLRNLIRFLNDGDRAKVTVRFRGRELAHQHIGMELIQRLKADLAEHGTVDQELGPESAGHAGIVYQARTLNDVLRAKDPNLVDPNRQRRERTRRRIEAAHHIGVVEAQGH